MAKQGAASGKPVATVVATKRGLTKKGVVILLVVVVLAAAGYGVWWWLHRSDTTGQPAKGPQTIDQAYGKQDYQAAVDIAKRQATDDPTSQMVLAAAYSNNKQYDQAYAIYDKLDAAGKLSGQDTMAAGELAQGAGNTAKALSYYQKAKVKLQNDTSRYAPRNLNYVNRQLAELQK